MANHSNAHILHPDRNEEIFRQKIVRMLEKFPAYSCQPSTPRVWLLGGQPGAGKSTLAGKYSLAAGRAVEISADRFRVVHDDWDDLLADNDETAAHLTNPDARLWVEKAAKHLIKRRANVLVDATLSDPIYAQRLISKFPRIYFVKVLFVATPRPVSLWSNVNRYEELSGPTGRPARTCRREDYDEICNGVLETARGIDNLTIPVDAVRVICRRTKLEIYRADASSAMGGAATAIEDEQYRPWDDDYTANFLADWRDLRMKMAWRGTRWDPWFSDMRSFAIPLVAPGYPFPPLELAG